MRRATFNVPVTSTTYEMRRPLHPKMLKASATPNDLPRHVNFFDKCSSSRHVLFPKKGIPAWDRRLLRSKIILERKQMKNGKKKKEKQRPNGSLLRRRSVTKRLASLACLSFVILGAAAFPRTAPGVEVVVLDVGDDGVREQVLHAVPVAQGPPDVCGADLVLHWLPDQENVVLAPLQDGRVRDVPLQVVASPAHTHQAELLHYFLDVLVFPEVGGLEGLQDICPAEELQLRHSWKDKGRSQPLQEGSRPGKITYPTGNVHKTLLGMYWRLNVFMLVT